MEKDFSVLQLPRFINTFKNGGALISPIMARHLMAHFDTPVHHSKGLENLTPRENQVLMHLAEGNTYEEVEK
ncbi:MAG: response regulator transcription factor [Saprospiraceae bacterium]|nr:response regulator transcription factor [Saprospiraceae bacterium]